MTFISLVDTYLTLVKPRSKSKMQSVTAGILCIRMLELFRYSPKSNKWIEMACLAQKWCGSSACVLDGKFYVVGGYDEGCLSSVERYDPAINEWEFVASLNVPRWGHCCCTINGVIYAIGGSDSNNGYIASIEKYDANNDEWTMVPFNIGVPRRHFGIFAEQEWIYIFGGKTVEGVCSDDVFKINILNGEIVELQSMPFRMDEVQCCGNRV